MKSAITFILCVVFAAATIVSAEDFLPLKDRWYLSTAGMTSSKTTVSRRSLLSRKPGGVKAESTYYIEEDLKHAACYGRDNLPNYNAKDTDFIAAMYMNNLEHCYRCIEVCRGSSSRCVKVKVIDKCGGCPSSSQNVDLTSTAFQKIATLSEGRVGIRWRPIRCPAKGRWPTFEQER
ncbi:6358_t:CDS:1 [Diversispora eburnea]|uniref:6358_t:CDS:1 n=1 Tax=Diversispora eburnea TaxID=1213867 RepID=A0A9N9AUH7_9GLOM|nr:6358_t:CDS:1 [Diversispora eburnea]